MLKGARKYLKDPNMTVEKMSSISKAGKGLLTWVVAISKYHDVAKSVEPLKAKVREREARAPSAQGGGRQGCRCGAALPLLPTGALPLLPGGRPLAPAAPGSIISKIVRPIAANGRRWVPFVLMVLWMFVFQEAPLDFRNLFCLIVTLGLALKDMLS